MSDFIVCPVCETQNSPDATHCEVCGERLAPAQPGEEVNPEENVAAMIAEETPDIEEDPQEPSPIPDANEPEAGFDLGDEEDLGYDAGVVTDADVDALPADANMPPATAGETVIESDPEKMEMAAHNPAPMSGDAQPLDPGNRPEVLYSSISGEAYPKGSPEYEEGFGPMGEELVAEPPATVPQPEGAAPELTPSVEEPLNPDEEALPTTGAVPAHDDGAAAPDDTADSAAVHPPAGDEEDVALAEPEAPNTDPEMSEPEPAFTPSGPNPDVELPTPSTYDIPATVTLYVDREPVMTHEIQTDETLIGREDIRADVHPDIDLTEYDPESYISRKHAYIYRQNKNYTLYSVSNGGVQLNNDMLDLGDKRQLSDGDVIVLAGFLAIKFEIHD